MRVMNDIRPQKEKLRAEFLKSRRELPLEEKQKLDIKIARKLMDLWLYREASLILTYVSTKIEVDTFEIINSALKQGKHVAVPRCVDGTRHMDFYLIKSLNELSIGSFGVFEPDPEKCDKLEDLSSGLCIVPALGFDINGYRLGYGKGYYDRFLSRFYGERVGLTYSFNLCDNIPHGKYDKKINCLVTDKNIIKN